MRTALTSLPRTVWLLGLVSLLNDAASDLVYPLLPLYLSAVLMAGPRALGLIEGLAEALNSMLKLVSGVWSDRLRSAKPFVVCGYSLAALSRPLLVLAASWPGVLGLRLMDRLGKGLRSSPRDALLAASVPEQQRGLAFGLHRAMDNAGAVIGPLTAAALLAWHVPIDQIFLWTALPGGLAVLLTLALREPAGYSETPPAPIQWSPAALPPVFRRYLCVLALFTLGNSSNMFLLLRARELGLPEAQIPLLWGLVSAMAMLFSTHLSALSDKLGRKRLIVAGWALYGGFYGLMAIDGFGSAPLWGLFAAYGLFMAATEGVEKALVADLAPRHTLGTAYGWFNLVSGLMLLPASLAFGTLWQWAGAPVAFMFSAGCALAAAALMWRLR